MESSESPVNGPFDNLDANVIIRSSDGSDFRVFKEILAIASPVFKQMFALPCENAAQQASDDTVAGIPVIHVSEEGQTIKMLLSLFYPVPPQTFTKLEEVRAVLEVARKYEMEVVKMRVESALMSFAQAEPLQVFALARTYMSEEVVQRAARCTLQWAIEPTSVAMPEELRLLSLPAFWALMQYHHKCIKAATRAIETKWFSPAVPKSVKGHTAFPREWVWNRCDDSTCQNLWSDYMECVGRELSKRPLGSIAQTPAMLEPALRKAGNCEYCRPEAFQQLTEYSKRLADAVDEATSKIRLELDE
ncbi:hypothetical protein B0H21DRAFT_890097 [Amylocystis lapponica]|nr:hypothetical protein B0H21DRAFT_890097 [Amylocystis lapponica]